MTDLKNLELMPFKLDDIPSDLEWCVYPEERKRGEVFCPETIYRIVLALRWILTYTDWGLEEEFETWKVYWKNDDKYGFVTRIYLFREKVEQFDNLEEDYWVLQEQAWCELAMLRCSGGQGIVTDVFTSFGQPYGGTWRLDGVMGVRRLLEDAIVASDATHNYYPIIHTDKLTHTYRVSGSQEALGMHLGFKLRCDHTAVTAIDLEVWQGLWW